MMQGLRLSVAFRFIPQWALCVTATLLLQSCATTKVVTIPVDFSQDVQVTVGSAEPKEFKKGESLELQDQPVWVESPGHVGVLLLPPAQGGSKSSVQVKLRRIEDWSDPKIVQKNNAMLNELIVGVNIAQRYIAGNRSAAALETIESLLIKYPTLSQLKFLKASCLLLMGERQRAKGVLESALKDYPDQKEGRELYEALTGLKMSPKKKQRGGG